MKFNAKYPMKYIDEFRDPAQARFLASRIASITTRPWSIMEVCGGQTHSIIRFGIDQLLPKEIRLIHGPGCPVCVTSIDVIDRAVEIATEPKVILCTFGDMLRVPGTKSDLMTAKACGADVRIVYSPLDAVALAAKTPDRQVVFFGVGFETTAPANGMAIFQAAKRGLRNFSALTSHVLVPPALVAVLSSPQNQVQAFLAAGHVCTIMGYKQYEPISESYRVPIVVTGFEPLDILQGIYFCVRQLESGKAFVENQYARSVNRGGNAQAQDILTEVFEVSDKDWRGLGEIPESGLRLRKKYADFDANIRFISTRATSDQEPAQNLSPRTVTTPCISGLILQGVKKPPECPEFGRRCTPEKPLGATMVSSEGACSAYYRYRSPSNLRSENP